MKQPEKLLFICSYNVRRSLTAEWMYDGCSAYSVRSAGTEEGTRTEATKDLIEWADTIFVMEPDHLHTLRQRFGEALVGKKVHCLDIPDIYNFMEPALVSELRMKLTEYVGVPG